MKIKIFGTSWNILEKKGNELKELYGKDDEELDGYCDYDTQTIYVKKELSQHRKNVAVTHELLHALFDYAGVWTNNEEGLVRQMEHHVYELLKKFPEKYRE